MLVIRVKICGLTRAQDVRAAIDAGCDYCGFVHEPASPRHLDAGDIKKLMHLVRSGGRKAVLVISNMNQRLVETLKPDVVQYHGEASTAELEALLVPDCALWKAVPVQNLASLQKTKAFADVAEALLLDAPPPQKADRAGGWGKVFDWGLLQQWEQHLPFMLAGGLEADNVGEAIARTRAWGVDVSSGVEAAPGRKDHRKMNDFVLSARQAALCLEGEG